MGIVQYFKNFVYKKSLLKINIKLADDLRLFGNSYYLRKEGLLFKRAIRLDPRDVIMNHYYRDIQY